VEPTTALPAIALLSLVTVEFGGWALLGFITKRRGELGPFREQFFRAGHAHAGVLLVLSLVAFAYFERAELSEGTQWLLGFVLLAGVLAQSGGFFLHLAVGREGEVSPGTKLTRAGGIVIAVPLVWLAIALLSA
jgi:hypothetical protein